VTPREVIGRFGTAITGVALVVFFLAFAPNFANAANIVNVLNDTSFLAILALGFTLAFTVAELDLSIAEMASLSAVVCGWLVQLHQPPAVAAAAGVTVGAVLGATNGFGVTVLRIPSLIMTLGTASIAKGFAFMITQGISFGGRWPVGFTGISRGISFGIPNLVLWLSAVTLCAYVLVKWTRTGAHMDRHDPVIQPGLLQEHRYLVPVRRGPVIQLDHDRLPMPRASGRPRAGLE